MKCWTRPELRYTPDETVANFSIAVNRRRRVGEEYKDETEWFNIDFSRTENVNQYLTKGRKYMLKADFKVASTLAKMVIKENPLKSANEVTFLSSKRSRFC